jgi:hypothetical protein
LAPLKCCPSFGTKTKSPYYRRLHAQRNLFLRRYMLGTIFAGPAVIITECPQGRTQILRGQGK